MTDTASDVLFQMGAQLTDRLPAANGDAAPATVASDPVTPDGPAVICGKCNTIHVDADVHRVECRMCNASLLAEGIYIGGACPYALDCPIPYGKCHCGCGEATIPYNYAHPKEGAYIGAKGRFLRSHAGRGVAKGVEFVQLRSNKPSRSYPRRDPKRDRNFVVAPVRAVLVANPGKTFTTQTLAKRAKVTPKQASTAFSTLKATDPSFQGKMGSYTYVPSGDTATSGESASQPTQWPHQRDGMVSHRKSLPGVLTPGQQVHLSPLAQELYDAFEKIADHNGRVSVSAANAMKAVTRRNVSTYTIQQALTELHDVGCIDATNNRVKYLLQHPDGTPFVPADPDHPVPTHIGRAVDVIQTLRKTVTPTRALPGRDAYVHAERAVEAMQAFPNVEEIDEDRLGTALAKLMWERYEWALAEVGRLHEVVAEQKERLDRCEALLAEQPMNISAIARRFLVDLPK